jgi:hypothetical protein
MAKLGPSYEGTLEEDWPQKPEEEVLPWTYWRRGRAILTLLGIVGLGCFFLPWADVTAPEITTFTGVTFARVLGWVWACPVAWVMLIATALSRRTVGKMRGARVAAAFFSALPVVTTLVLLLSPPQGGIVPVRFTYEPALYTTLVLGVLSLPFAIRFGGRIDDLPMAHGSGGGEILN